MRIPDPRADGPQLFATQFGRQSGSVESFNYTEANKKAAVHWDENTLFGESQVGHVSSQMLRVGHSGGKNLGCGSRRLIRRSSKGPTRVVL